MLVERDAKRARLAGNPSLIKDLQKITSALIELFELEEKEFGYVIFFLEKLNSNICGHVNVTYMVARAAAIYGAMARLQGSDPLPALGRINLGEKEEDQSSRLLDAIMENAHWIPQSYQAPVSDGKMSRHYRPPALCTKDHKSWLLTKRLNELEFLTDGEERICAHKKLCESGGLPLIHNSPRSTVLRFDGEVLRQYLLFILVIASLHEGTVAEDTLSIILYTWGEVVVDKLQVAYGGVQVPGYTKRSIPWGINTAEYQYLRNDIDDRRKYETNERKAPQLVIKGERLNSSIPVKDTVASISSEGINDFDTDRAASVTQTTPPGAATSIPIASDAPPRATAAAVTTVTLEDNFSKSSTPQAGPEDVFSSSFLAFKRVRSARAVEEEDRDSMKLKEQAKLIEDLKSQNNELERKLKFEIPAAVAASSKSRPLWLQGWITLSKW